MNKLFGVKMLHRIVLLTIFMCSCTSAVADGFALSTWIRFGERVNSYTPIVHVSPELRVETYATARLRAYVPGGGALITEQITGTLNNWYHVLVWSDGTTADIYVNGRRGPSVAVVGSVTEAAWKVFVGANGNQWDVGDSHLWNVNIPSAAAIIDFALVGGPIPESPANTLLTGFKPEFVPVVIPLSAKLNQSGLLTFEFSHRADRGSKANEFAYPVAWRSGSKICHAPTTGLSVGDAITIPARFIEVKATGEFNAQTTLTIEPAEELPTTLPTKRIKLAGNGDTPRYYSEGYEFGNDFQRLNASDWRESRAGDAAIVPLDPITGVPTADAAHHWCFGQRVKTDGYYLFWQGSGELMLSYSITADAPAEQGMSQGWKYKRYDAGFDQNLWKIGNITAMKGQWAGSVDDLDYGSTLNARELWAPFSCYRAMQSIGTNNSSIETVDDLVGSGFVGQYKNCNLPAQCRLINELSVETAWFCMPHAADEACMRRFFELIRDNLDASIDIYAEYSNEVWNYGGAYLKQTRYVVALGKERGTDIDEAYAFKSKQMEDIGIEVLGNRYKKTVLAGQFAVPSKANRRYLLGLEQGIRRGAISNAVYFSPDILYDDESTKAAMFVMTAEQLIDLVRVSLDEDAINFGIIRNFLAENPDCESLAYEGGWAFSNSNVNANNFDSVGRVALEAAMHPRQLELHHYAYTLAQEAGFTLFMHLAPSPSEWDLIPAKFKTWTDRWYWDQEAGIGDGQSARAWAPYTWAN